MSKLQRLDATGKAARRLKIARAVRRHLEDGDTLAAATEKVGIPRRTFLHWVRTDAAVEHEYRLGRVTQADLGGDAVREIAEQAKHTTDSGTLQSLRLQADCFKWIAGKLAPRVYGALSAVPQSVAVNVLFDAPKAKPRAIAAPQPDTTTPDFESPMTAEEMDHA